MNFIDLKHEIYTNFLIFLSDGFRASSPHRSWIATFKYYFPYKFNLIQPFVPMGARFAGGKVHAVQSSEGNVELAASP